MSPTHGNSGPTPHPRLRPTGMQQVSCLGRASAHDASAQAAAAFRNGLPWSMGGEPARLPAPCPRRANPLP